MATRVSFHSLYGYWFRNSGAFLGLQEIPVLKESSQQSGLVSNAGLVSLLDFILYIVHIFTIVNINGI